MTTERGTPTLVQELRQLADREPTIFDVHYTDWARRLARWAADTIDAAEYAIRSNESALTLALRERDEALRDARRWRHVRLMGYPRIYNYWNQEGMSANEDNNWTEPTDEHKAQMIDAAIDAAIAAAGGEDKDV